jgi:hypothetical protein
MWKENWIRWFLAEVRSRYFLDTKQTRDIRSGEKYTVFYVIFSINIYRIALTASMK